MGECQQRMDQFLARDLRRWEGLTPGCTEAGMLDGHRTLGGLAAGRLGRSDVDYEVRAVEAAGFNEPVLVHVRDGVVEVLRTEYWSFDAFECATLLEALGDPPDRADLIWREWVYPDREWLYTERGLALGVLPETNVIVTAAAFAPRSADDYLDRFARVRPGREFPAPAR